MSLMGSRLLLIDGHSMAYRAFYALPAENFTTADGQHTNALYGFATMLISLIREEKPTHVAVGFDVSRKTFRTLLYPEYKATRASTPDEFRSQMPLLHELVRAFGISQFELEGFEADDILATLATKAQSAGMEVLICSGDRDTFQLVNEKVTVLYPKRGVSELSRMNPGAVLEKYGMTPAQYPDFAALRGDPSDNLPSVPGVGEKTAAKWIIEFHSLANLISNIDKVGGKVGDSLRANLDVVTMNRDLTRLSHDVPIDFDLESLSWRGVEEIALYPLFDKLEFRTLKDRVKPLVERDGVATTLAAEPLMMLGFDPAESVLSPEEASARIAAHNGKIALTYDIQNDRLLRYAIAISGSEGFLVHGSKVGPWGMDPQIPKILHDAKTFDRVVGIEAVVFDTSLAAYLVNPGVRAQELSDLFDRWGDGAQVDIDGREEKLVLEARNLFALEASLRQELEERQSLTLFTNLELPVAKLLARMERRGVAVDAKKLLGLRDFFAAEAENETNAAYKVAGREFNVASPKQVQVVLFQDLNLPKTKKIKTGYTTDAESLEWLAAKTQHPILSHLLRIRETNKLKTTVEGLLSEIGEDGRIHTHFQQTVAATGRLSSTGPNLQNIPVRTEEGRKIRDCFIAGSEFVALLTADYSQIEMRIMAHLSQDAHLLAAFKKGEDLHSTVACEVFGVQADDVNPEMRRQIKAMSYGLAYGLSAFGLSAQLGITPAAAQALMDRYFERFGGIRDYLQSVVEQARKVGYTETILGRRRYLPDLLNDNRARREIAERMALNSPIQGSAADIIKEAMLRVEREIEKGGFNSRLLLQVHDELIVEIAEGEEEEMRKLVSHEMALAYPLKAPLTVGIGVGKSWNEAAH